MKNRSFATLGTLALLAAGAAFGQTNLTADIPFEFGFAGKVMPAGHYDITKTHDLLTVRCYAASAGALAPVNALDTPSQDKTGTMVFHKYGDKYFLAEVWTSAAATGAGVIESKAEREIARGAAVARVTIPIHSGVVTLASLR